MKKYEPFHLKYRPRTFAELVGQDAIATTLQNAIRTQRIAPAYLFSGPRGTGKTSCARILAMSLNCIAYDAPTETPCRKCQVCQAIASGTAIDVVEIDGASNNGIENIRNLIERAQFAPMQYRHKVYVIDEAQGISGPGFQALLKTIEEPVAQVVFVLATTDPQRIPATIISRCQRFDFRRIALDAMVQHLRDIAKIENINITSEAITLIAQLSQGGLRDAESLLDQLSLLSGEVTTDKVWDLVGAVPEHDLLAILSAIALGNPDKLVDETRKQLDKGREPLVVLQNIAGFYRDLLIAKTAPSKLELAALTAPTWKALCQEAKRWNTATIVAGQKHLSDSVSQVKNTTQPQLWLEVTLLSLLVVNRPTIASVANAKSVVHHPPDSLKELTSQELDLDKIWQQILLLVRVPSIKNLLQQHGRLTSCSSGIATVQITSLPLLNLVTPKVAVLEDAFKAALGQPISITLVKTSK